MEIEDAISKVNMQLNNINKACFTYIAECSDFVNHAMTNHNKLLHKIDIIYTLLGHKKVRITRGLINIIGTGLKTLFGTMDNADAEYYDNVVNTMKENEEFIRNGLREEVNIMKSLNEQNQILTSNYYKIENQSKSIVKNLDLIIQEINDKDKKNSIIQYLRSLQIQTFTRLTELEIELSKIVDAILFLQSKVIHPIIITPDKFISILKSSKHASNLIYTPSIESYYILIKDVKIKCYEKNHVINVILSIPFVKSQIIETYEIINLPFKHNKQWFLTENENDDKIILINKNKENFALKKNNNECNKIETNEGNYYICNEIVLENSLKNNVCVVNVFMKRTNKNCNVKIIPNELQIFHKINNNKYIYVVNENTKYKCNCSNTIDEGYLSDIGIINLKENCKFITVDFEIETKINVTEELNNNDVYHFGLEDCCLNIKLEDIKPLENIAKFKSSNLENLKDLSIELNNQESYVTRILKGIPEREKNIFFGITGILIISLCGYITCKCYKGGNTFNLFNKCFNKKNKKPICQEIKYIRSNEHDNNLIEIRRRVLPSNEDGYLP